MSSGDHGPLQSAYEKKMNALAKILDTTFNVPGKPRKVGFALLVYEFGGADASRMNYIGNGERSDVLIALKELVARWEGRTTESDTKQ